MVGVTGFRPPGGGRADKVITAGPRVRSDDHGLVTNPLVGGFCKGSFALFHERLCSLSSFFSFWGAELVSNRGGVGEPEQLCATPHNLVAGNVTPCRSCIAGDVLCAERFKSDVRPMSAGKKRVSTGGTRRGMGSSAYVWIAEITSGTHLSAAGAHSNLQRLGLLASRRESQSTKVGRMSSWSDEGRVMPAYVAGDATLGEVTLQRGKGTLGRDGYGKSVQAFRTPSRVCVWDHRAEQ